MMWGDGGEVLGMRNAVASVQSFQNPNMLRGKAHHRSGTPLSRTVKATSTIAAGQSKMTRHRRYTRQRKSEPAAFESNTSTLVPPKRRSLPDGARTAAH